MAHERSTVHSILISNYFIIFNFIYSIPTCIDYSFDEEAPDEESLLLFGDAAGGMTIVHFLQPLNSLFEKDEVDSVQCLFWPDMVKHEEFARIDYFPSLHSDGILGESNTVDKTSMNSSFFVKKIL